MGVLEGEGMPHNNDVSKSLRSNHLSFSYVLASSLGIMGVFGSVVVMIPIVFTNAGNGTFFAFIAAMVAYILVALQINIFASRIVSTGSLYTFVQHGLGSLAGTTVGWSLFLGYWACVSANLVTISYYLLVFMKNLTGLSIFLPTGIHMSVLACCISILAWWLTCRGVKLSTWVILIIECATLGLIFLIIGSYFWGKGISPDLMQLGLYGVQSNSFSLGLVLAMACFTGFEACSVLGVETKLPLTMIPRANLMTIVLTGGIIAISSYALIQAFHEFPITLDKDNNPMNTFAKSLGLEIMAPLISLGVAFSWFGCLLGCLNTGGRILYSMSHQGLVHEVIAKVHNKHRTPHIAVGLIAISGLMTMIILLKTVHNVMDIISYLAVFIALGFLMSYILVSIASVAYVRSHNLPLRKTHIVSSILAVILMLIALIGTIYPMPIWPMNIIPVIFGILLILGVGYFVRFSRKPKVINKCRCHHILRAGKLLRIFSKRDTH
jgi:amino acid transporter